MRYNCFQDANTFVPNNANVAGTCKESDAETLLLTFKDFSLEWSFAKVSIWKSETSKTLPNVQVFE